jgi:hypothetical protein
MEDISLKEIPKYLIVIVKAIWNAFEKTETIVAIVLAAVAVWSWISHGSTSEFHPPGVIVAALVAIFAIYQILKGMFFAYENERKQRERLQIKLTPLLKPGIPNVAATGMGDQRIPARYFRIPILNGSAGVAKHCSARLTKIEITDRNGFRQLNFNDTLEMAWSNKPAENAKTIDIHPSVAETLDIVFAYQRSRVLHLATIIRPFAYENLMDLAGEYQFTVQVTCEGRAPLNMLVRCHWGLDFETLAPTGEPITIL